MCAWMYTFWDLQYFLVNAACVNSNRMRARGCGPTRATNSSRCVHRSPKNDGSLGFSVCTQAETISSKYVHDLPFLAALVYTHSPSIFRTRCIRSTNPNPRRNLFFSTARLPTAPKSLLPPPLVATSSRNYKRARNLLASPEGRRKIMVLSSAKPRGLVAIYRVGGPVNQAWSVGLCRPSCLFIKPLCFSTLHEDVKTLTSF